jgi:hypothetical protein
MSANKKYFEYLESKGKLPKVDSFSKGGVVEDDDDDAKETEGDDLDEDDKLYALDEEQPEPYFKGGLVGNSPVAHLLQALKKRKG